MTVSQKALLALIRYEMFNIPFPDEFSKLLTHEIMEEIFAFSTEYDVAYIVGTALSKLDLMYPEAKSAYFNEQLSCIYRSESISHELESIGQLFTKAKIDFIPLKGAVIRDLYPKPEMRTSCDIDILVHEADLKKAVDYLKDELNYTYFSKTSHDVALNSPSGVELELHYSLYEGDNYQKIILDKVWNYAYPKQDSTYWYELKKEFFMLYHVIHLYKHIKAGGCGLRPFLDLCILEDKLDYDKKAFDALVWEAGLAKFTQGIFDIAHMWFGTKEETYASELMASYIFSAGAYGGIENNVAVSSNRNGSKFKSIFKRIFMPYRQLKITYPIIEKYSFLTPVFEVVRWFRIIFKDKGKKGLDIIRQTGSLTDEKKDEVKELFRFLGF